MSVSLEQEAVVGSPFTVEALAALPEIRELENMSVGDINAILVKMTPDASSQALASLPPEQAAEALAGHSGAAAARMMNGMFPSATAQVLSGMPAAAAAAAVGAMSEEKVADVLGAMAPADGAKLMAATSPEETAAKADVFASALGRMSDEESAAALRAMAAASAEAGSADGVAAVMNKMPPAAVANALASMSPEDNVRLVGAMGADEAAAAIGAMDDARVGEVLFAMGAEELAGLTDGLGAAYEDDKRLPAAERQKMRDAAAERAKQLAPALASVPPAKLADSLKDADPSQIAGTLNALVHEGKAAPNLLRAMPKAAQKKAAARMLESCPEGTAGAILGDFTGDECAALMAGLSPDEHAKALAELWGESQVGVRHAGRDEPRGGVARDVARRRRREQRHGSRATLRRAAHRPVQVLPARRVEGSPARDGAGVDVRVHHERLRGGGGARQARTQRGGGVPRGYVGRGGAPGAGGVRG